MKRLLALSASAGSGKTFSLASRYLSLLFQEINPSDILAVTFTNKAANEMKERIIKYLINFENENAMRELISKETGIKESILLDRSSIILKKFLISDVYILTIDAFINKILRKFSWYVKIENDFEIGSDDKEIVLKEFLDNLSPNEFEELITISKRESKMQHNMQDLLESLYNKDKELPQLNFTTKKLNKDDAFKSFNRLKEYILDTATTKSAKKAINIEFEEIPSTTWFSKNSLKEYNYFKKIYVDWFDNEFFKIKQFFKEYFSNREKEFLKNLFSLYEKYKKTKFYYKKENNRLDFKDIENLTYELLREDKFIEDIKEFIYFRLDSRIDHILIDEFQDTSITQWKIFEPLVEEIASGEGVNPFKTFFYVGDTKQSIYRFRGGQKELFNKVAKQFEPFGLKVDNLKFNYRSKENIVEFVNDKFKDIMIERQLPIEENSGGYVEIIEEDNILNGLKSNLSFMLDNGVQENDIAILVWTNKDILTVSEFIKKEFQKETVTSTRAKVLNQPFVEAIVNLMKYLYNKNDLLYKFNFLSLIGEKWNNKEIEIPIMKPSKMIKFIMDKYKLIDESSLRLYEYSFKYDTLIDFVYDIDLFDEELPAKELNGIQVLTIHKSKGLEFENVIVLDSLNKKNNKSEDIIFDYKDVELKDIKINFRGRDIVDEEFKKIKKRENELEIKDDKNAEYVAFTRAVNSLFIIKKSKSSRFISNLEPQVFGEFKIEKKDTKEKEHSKFDYILRNYGKQEYKELEENEYKPNDFNAIYFGLATHYAFETENIEAVRNKYGEFCNIQQVREFYEKGKTLLPNNGIIYKEFPFIYNDKVGIIDLMIEKNDEIIIIDYKTHSPNDEMNYIKQLNRYKIAIKNLFQKNVKGKIFYLDKMLFKEV